MKMYDNEILFASQRPGTILCPIWNNLTIKEN